MTLAQIWGIFFVGASWMLALGWIWQWSQWVIHLPELADLNGIAGSLPGMAQGESPDLTVVVPACNEEKSIELTLRTLLASTGLRLEIVAVDDRSTDRTGALMDRIAEEAAGKLSNHRLRVLHIAELPHGWLGKPHALATAAHTASAEWILFTDGDVRFAPDALALALRYARAERADHVVLMPDWLMGSPGEAAMHGAIHALSAWTLRLWRVADPKARDFLGVGAFNLVRRSAYEELGGFSALRMEVLEDLRFGWRLKRAGYRQRVALGPGLAAVRWADSAWGVVLNLEKNLFALYRYKTPLALMAALGLLAQIVWPMLAIAAGGWARVAGVVTYGAISALYFASRKVTRVPPAYVLVFPLAAGLFLFAVLRSMVLALARGGVVWRGTLYSLKELRAAAGEFW